MGIVILAVAGYLAYERYKGKAVVDGVKDVGSDAADALGDFFRGLVGRGSSSGADDVDADDPDEGA